MQFCSPSSSSPDPPIRSETVIPPSAEPMGVDIQSVPPLEDESDVGSSEVHITPADTAGVIDAHVILVNLSLAQPVNTSQLSDSDSAETLLKSSHLPDGDSDIPLPSPKLNSVTKLAQNPGYYI